MKSVIQTIVVLLIAVSCKGQTPEQRIDKAFLQVDTLNGILGGTMSWQQLNDYRNFLGYDTVKMIIQYSDTSRQYKMGGTTSDTIPFYDTLIGGMVAGSIYLNGTYNYDYSIKWMFGYSVRKKYCCINGNTSNLAYYQAVPYYEHDGYLDSDKKPLAKSILIWQSFNQQP